jgi:hypothetical protein
MFCATGARTSRWNSGLGAFLTAEEGSVFAVECLDAFRVTRAGLEEARDAFRRLDVGFSFEDHGIARSLYVHDPDGHKVGLTTYEV